MFVYLPLMVFAFVVAYWIMTPTLVSRPQMVPIFTALLVAVLIGFVFWSPAHAAEIASGSRVDIPIGAIINELVLPIFATLGAALLWLIRHLPKAAQDLIRTYRADQLAFRALAYGINSTANAAQGKTLSVDVHLPVLARALTFFLERAPALLVQWIGGPATIAANIWSRMIVDDKATAPDFKALAAMIAGGSTPEMAVARLKREGGA